MQKGLLTESDTTESSATKISDSVDIRFDKTMYLREHNEKNISYSASALYILFIVRAKQLLSSLIESSTTRDLTFVCRCDLLLLKSAQ